MMITLLLILCNIVLLCLMILTATIFMPHRALANYNTGMLKAVEEAYGLIEASGIPHAGMGKFTLCDANVGAYPSNLRQYTQV